MIFVFAYAFAHQKTHDFLVELKLSGIDDVFVIAAPWKKLTGKNSEVSVRVNLQKPKPHNTSIICKRLGFKFVEIEHDNVVEIAELIKFHKAVLAIISGARIIKKDVIDLFSLGIVNFHPGKLPETAGLNAFFYAIEKNVPMGVTAHFINNLIDAGQEISFQELKINRNDTVEDVSNNLYYLQINALRSFLNAYSSDRIEVSEIVRPGKNSPMPDEVKKKVLGKFNNWKNSAISRQLGEDLLVACKEGKLDKIKVILEQEIELIEYKNSKGWTPLIVAAFNQHYEIVKLLIDLGANPNATNINGTTVLMYAKTKLLTEKQPDLSILRTLINAGANVSTRDIHGKCIIDYSTQNPILCAFLVENLQ